MPYFAYCPNGVVQKVERIDRSVMLDDGQESEAMGQAFLAELYPGTEPEHYVMTHYPVGQPDPYPRGCYAGLGFTWDGTTFAPPQP